MQKIRVGVNGYGTIGKRVADAVALQPDMELVGITAHSFNYRIATAAERRRYPVFSLNDDVYRTLTAGGVSVAGGLDDLLESADIIVDCSPKHGEKNKELYLSQGKKAIFQGGEKASIADMSLVSQCDYSRAVGRDYIRVVSCNTTGLSRTIHAIDKKYGIEHTHAEIIRRGTDSHDHKRGPINAIETSFEQPSHHGLDVRTVLPREEIFTIAHIVPTTLMHVHSLTLDMRSDDFGKEDIVRLLDATPRTMVLPAGQKLDSTAQVMDYYRDLLRNPRGDMHETGVWEDSVGIYRAHGYNRLFLRQCIHQESNVIPENIDAIRAAMGFTDSALAEEPYRQFADAIRAAREVFRKTPLYIGGEDKMEEVNPSRIITDIHLNIFKGF